MARLPVGRAQQYYGAPYWVLHRGDLQAALLAAVSDHADVTIELGMRVQLFDANPKGVVVKYLRNSVAGDATGIGFVGADGLWSAARACLGERSRPQSGRRTAWRALVPAEAVPAEFREPVVNLWIGPEAHIVHYPVRAGEAINIVAIAGSEAVARIYVQLSSTSPGRSSSNTPFVTRRSDLSHRRPWLGDKLNLLPLRTFVWRVRPVAAGCGQSVRD